jgi:hypothetical protein
VEQKEPEKGDGHEKEERRRESDAERGEETDTRRRQNGKEARRREWHHSFFPESQRQAQEGFLPAAAVNQVSFSFLLLPFIIAQTLCRCNLITLWL